MDDTDEREELRLAIILNGGVSLAIWMGGAVHEVDRLARGEGIYLELLKWAGAKARVDVIAGTSAGGINGAALAVSQCNSQSQGLSLLREVWADDGDINKLLRQPFKGSPPSLLQGDEFFLPRLNEAIRKLAGQWSPKPLDDCPLDLTITGTLLKGIQGVTVDSLGQRITQTRHDGLFRFRRGPTHPEGSIGDDFPKAVTGMESRAAATPLWAALALAARTTASFPVAFEPSFIPTNADLDDPLHPDMRAYASGAWDQSPGDKPSRYAIDGGVLANTPTRPALEAINRMPANGLLRRVVLLVHPHAPAPEPMKTDVYGDDLPTVTGVGAGMLGALQSQGSLNHVQEIEAHNRLTAGRRRLRADVVTRPGAPEGLLTEAQTLWPWYGRVRTQRAARDLASIWQAAGKESVEPFAKVFQGIEDQIEEGSWLGPTPVDWTASTVADLAGQLGIEGALGVADVAVDYLKRLNWAVRSGQVDLGDVPLDDIRKAVSLERNSLLTLQDKYLQACRRLASSTRGREEWLQWSLYGHSAASGEIRLRLETIAEIVNTWAVLPGGVGEVLDETGDFGVLLAFAAKLYLNSDVAPPGTGSDDALLGQLCAIHIITHVVSDEVTTGASLPVELAQLTFQVKHPFAAYLTGESKVAGDLIHRFSAFLKRYWRLNDWTWGRLDASRTLCRVVLDPVRVRRILPELLASTDKVLGRMLMASLVDTLYAQLFLNTYPPQNPPQSDALFWSDLGLPPKGDVVTELLALLGSGAEGPTPVDKLTDVFAMALALDIAGSELPELVDGVEQDIAEGSNKRARGAVSVKLNKTTLIDARTGGARERRKALDVFARSGIGQEALVDEVTSDNMIAAATNAAATAITLADGDSSGLAFAKPVTRALRGGALIPYWSVKGLTGGPVARGLAILALAVGGVLFTLGIFGQGPAWFVAVGAGAVLGAIAYAALRTGTLLHGIVLLVPGLALLAWAWYDKQDGKGESVPSTAALDESAQSTAVLVAILAITAALILLGSLRQPIPSPLAWAERGRRWAWVAAATAAAILLAWALTPRGRETLAAQFTDAVQCLDPRPQTTLPGGLPIAWAALGAVLIYAAVSVLYAFRVGKAWRLIVPGPEEPTGWREERVQHPTGLAAGWSVMYGLLLALICGLILSWYGFTWPRGTTNATYAENAASAVLLAAGISSVVLLLPVPWAMHRRTSRAVEARARGLVRLDGTIESPERFLIELYNRGLNFRHLIMIRRPGTPPPSTGDLPWANLKLARRGAATLAEATGTRRPGWDILAGSLLIVASLVGGVVALGALSGTIPGTGCRPIADATWVDPLHAWGVVALVWPSMVILGWILGLRDRGSGEIKATTVALVGGAFWLLLLATFPAIAFSVAVMVVVVLVTIGILTFIRSRRASRP